jgi:hypothetical protein
VADTFGIPNITPPRVDSPEMQQALVDISRQMTAWLRRIADRVDEQHGNRGTPSFEKDVDFKGNRATQVGTPVADDDAQQYGLCLHLDPAGIEWDARNIRLAGIPTAEDLADAVNLSQLSSRFLGAAAVNAPPEVEDAGAVGTVTERFALEDHTHSGVNLNDAQTVAGAKTFSDAAVFSSSVEIDGALNHDGSTAGFYGTAPTAQASASADLTDNSGGTANDTVQALTDPGDSPATADALRDDLVANLIPELRNNFADVTAKVNDVLTALRNLGLIAT